MTTAFLSRRCRGSREAYRCVTSGRFLNGGGAAIAACTDTSIHLLVAQEGSLDGEGQLDVVCEQPLFATSRTVARLPGTVADEQDCLALLTDSGHVTILRFDADSTRLVVVQQLPLPPEEPGDPFSLLAVHPHGSAVAVAARSGALCLAVRQEADLAGMGAPLFLSPCLLFVDSPVCGLAFVQGCDEEDTAAAAVQDASTAAAAQEAASQLFSLAVLLWRRRPSRCILVEVGLQCSTLLDAGQPGSAVSCLAYARRLGGSTEGGSDKGGPPRALLQLPPPPQSQPGSGDSSLQHIQGVASLSTCAACVLLQHRQAEVAAASAASDPKLQPSGQLATAGSGPELGLREVQGEAESMELDGGGLAGAGPQSQQVAQVAAAAAGEAAGARGVCPATEAPEHHLNACETPSNKAAASDSGGDNESSSDSELDSELHSRSDGGSQSGSDSGGGGGGMASQEPSQPSIAGFTACCCWEWQEAAAAGEGGPLSTTLVCQLESGSFCELAVPYNLGATTRCFGAPSCQPDASEATVLPHSQLAQPARGMCSLPRRLLVMCTAAGGLLLLCRRPAPATTSGAAASVASSQPASWVAVRYEPLLPGHLAATQQQQQQQLQQQAEGATSATTAGCAPCTVPPAAPVVDCQLADLEGAGQPQLYSACLTDDGTEGGSLCTFYADPKPETAFELPGAAEGITGLWGLRRCSQDPHHSLVLLSYVGGSRLLAALDGVFRDVSESHPLKADAQTLAAGNLSVPAASGTSDAGAGLTVVAQVTSQGVMLICPAACPSPDAEAAAAAAAGWAEGPNEMSEEPPSRGGSYAWQPPPGSSVGAAAVADGLVLLFCTGGSSRHLVALVPAVAAGAAAVSAAAAAAAAAAAGSAAVGATPAGEGLSSASVQPQQGSLVLVEIGALPVAAELSCISGLLRQGPQHGSEGCTAVFAAGTYSSSVLLVQLQWDSQQQQGGRLQLLHTIDLTCTSAATLPPAAALAAAATPLSPRSYQREQLTPESLLLLPAAASDCGHDASGGGAAWSGAATVVVGLRTGGLLQLECSWGLTEKQQQQGLQQQQGEEEELLFLPLGTMPVVLLPLPPHQPSAAAAAAGLLPPTAAALSDRVSVLHHRLPAGPRAGAAGGSSLRGGRARCQQLALPHVQAAAALLLDSSGNSGGPLLDGAMAVDGEAEHGEFHAHKQPAQRPQQQLFLLCAATDGCLRMVSLEPAQLTSCRSWPLPQQLQPSRLAVHQASSSVAVSGTCQSPHWLWGDDADVSEEWRQAAVCMLDPQTGDQLASYRGFRPGEAVTALTVWDPPSHAQELLQQQLHQRQRQQQQQERERHQACGPASRGSWPDGRAGVAAGAAVEAAAVCAGGSPAAAASGSDDLRSHPVAIAPDSPLGASSSGEVSVGQTAAAAAAAGDEHPWGGFLVVGTSIDGSMEGGLPGEPEEWEDETSTKLQGRLLLLQLAAATSASGGGSRAAASWREAAAACEGEQQQQQPRRPLQLIAVAELHLPSRVTALCPGGRQLTGLKPLSSSSGSSSSGGGEDTSSRLFAAVGRRVVSFEWQQRQQLLRRVAWLPTMRAITSLRVSGGFLAAADPYEGATLYRYLDFPPGTPRSAMRAVGRLYRAQRQNVAGLELPRLALGPAPLGDEVEVAVGVAGAAGGVGPAARDVIRVVVDGNGEEYGFHAVATDCACRAAVGAVALPSAPTASSATVSGSGGNGGNPSAAAASAQRESAALAAAVLDAAGQLSLLQQLWPAVESTMSQRCSHSFREPAAALLPGSFAYRGEAGGGSAGPGARLAVPSRGEEEQAGAAATEMAMVAVMDSGAAVTLLPLAQRHASQLQQLQQALEQHPATAPLCGGTLAAFHGSRQGKRLFCHPPPAAATAAAAAQPPLPPSAATPNGAGGLGGGSLLVTEAAAVPDGEARPAPVAPSQPGTPVTSPRLQLPVLQPPAEQLHAVLDAELLQQYLLLSPVEQRQLVAANFLSCDGSQAAACSLAIQLTNLVARLLM